MTKIFTILFFILLANQSFAQIKNSRNSDDIKNGGIVLTIGGVGLTAAAILEGPGNYGTWSHAPNKISQYNMTYNKTPFWKQTPRNIMFVTGVTLTFTGLITAVINR